MLENDFTITDNGVLSYRGSVKVVLQSGQSTDICVERPVVRISVGAVTYLDPPPPPFSPLASPFVLIRFLSFRYLLIQSPLPREQRLIGPMTILLGTLSSLGDVEKRALPAVGPLSFLSDEARDHFLLQKAI